MSMSDLFESGRSVLSLSVSGLNRSGPVHIEVCNCDVTGLRHVKFDMVTGLGHSEV